MRYNTWAVDNALRVAGSLLSEHFPLRVRNQFAIYGRTHENERTSLTVNACMIIVITFTHRPNNNFIKTITN